MTDRDSSLLKRHATPEVVDCQKEAHVVRDVDRVHLIAFIELEELHRIVLQRNLLFYFLAHELHVHVVVLFIFVVDLINANQDLIVIAIE